MIKYFLSKFLVVSFLVVCLSDVKADELNGAYKYTFLSIDGVELPLADYRGKVILIVNTASKCGYTSQLSGLQELWEKYRESGLIVLGVPSNDFGGQELATETDIKKFCELNFGINFPMTSKTRVASGKIHPFFIWAKEELGYAAAPKWNFHKYIVGRNGQLVGWFSTRMVPEDKKLQDALRAALKLNPEV